MRHQIQRRSIALAVWRDIKQNQKIILRSRSTSIHGHEQRKGTLADWKALFLNRFCTALCDPILAEGSQQTCAPGLSRALWLSGMLLGAGLECNVHMAVSDECNVHMAQRACTCKFVAHVLGRARFGSGKTRSPHGGLGDLSVPMKRFNWATQMECCFTPHNPKRAKTQAFKQNEQYKGAPTSLAHLFDLKLVVPRGQSHVNV